MSARSRITVIGAGVMGRHHLALALANPDLEVVGIADPTPATREALASQGLPVFADHRRMLDEARPDGVIIAAPNALHVRLTLDCVERGIAALVEKPIADDLEDATRLAAAVEASGVPVLVGHHRRHNPLLRRAAAHIAEGALGRVLAVTGLWLRRKPSAYFGDRWKREPADGGGVLLINTIHDIDCLRMLCGEIVGVQAQTSSAGRGFAVEDTAAVVLRFASGALGTLTVSDATTAPWCWEMNSQEDPRFANVPEDCYLVCGTEGSLTVPTLQTWTNEPEADRGASLIRRRLHHLPADSLTEQLAHFAKVIRREIAPAIDVTDAARTLAATLAIRQSARTGELVLLDGEAHRGH